MATRNGMTDLLLEFRALTSAGSADYTVNGVAYFTDNQLQDTLDQWVTIYREVPLNAVAQRNADGADYLYKEFSIPAFIPRALEQSTSGTAYWQVRDSAGSAIGTASYTPNYREGLITFAADQVLDPNFTLDCRSYDMNRAAAVIWRQKAAMEYRSIDWSQAGASFRASQRRDFCLAMASDMDKKGGVMAVRMERCDEVGDASTDRN